MKHNEGFLALVNDAKSRVKQIGIEDYKKMPSAGHLLIDVREDNEWAAGHAAGAIHLGKGIIERDIETSVPDKSAALVLYCRTCAIPVPKRGRKSVKLGADIVMLHIIL